MAPTPSFLDLFRTLASFSPPRVSLRGAPWEAYVDWAIYNGLAPLAAYNLEYRLTGGGAPEWARDRLLSVYQGTVNDNVMKLVSFKRAVDDLQGRRILLLGGATYAEALYPHVAFRPVPEIRIRVDAADVQPLVGYLREAGQFKPMKDTEGLEGADLGVTDEHTALLIYSQLLGTSRAQEERALVDRALPVPVYGKSIFRPDLEDALLLTCLEQARAGYQVPALSFVDLRELVTGGAAMSGPYSRPPDFAQVRERARAWRIERALYASMSIVARLFPEAADAAHRAMPDLRGASKALLDRLVVDPVSDVGNVRTVRGAERLRRLLSGG